MEVLNGPYSLETTQVVHRYLLIAASMFFLNWVFSVADFSIVIELLATKDHGTSRLTVTCVFSLDVD